MANTSSTFQPDPDVHVTFEDQQKINKFARENAKLEELNDELNMKQKELQNLEDAGDELLMIEDDQPIPYMLGEVFVIMGQESATEM
ncbi:prefoldin subunit 4, partial [Tachypleus tridentatus]|uniref:prefoldin subunit 4 n=1 Tax=Tachypleus tridentatus TaxID=6853 RepID=UPI003FD17906